MPDGFTATPVAVGRNRPAPANEWLGPAIVADEAAALSPRSPSLLRQLTDTEW